MTHEITHEEQICIEVLKIYEFCRRLLKVSREIKIPNFLQNKTE